MAGTGFFSNKKGIREAKEAAGAIQYAGAKGMEETAAAKAQAQAAEMSKLQVFGLLGKEGTYGSNAPSWSAEDAATDPFDRSGVGLSSPDKNLWQSVSYSKGAMGREPVWNKEHTQILSGIYSPDQLEAMGLPREGEGTGLLTKAREGILDPTKYAKLISHTSAFKAQSQRVAESEQLLKQEGEEWDQLENSTLGVINSGAATMLRDTLRQLRNDQAKGGAARRAAKDQFDTILAQERIMKDRVEGTWKANIHLFEVVRQNADAVQQSTDFFVNNLPLVNNTFRSAVAQNAQLAIQAGQVAAAASQNAYSVKQSQQAVNFGIRFAEGLIGLVASAIPYVGPVIGGAIRQAGASGGYQPIGSQQGGGGQAGAGGGGMGGIGAISGILGSFGGGGGAGGAGGLGGIGSFFSDIRLKENIIKLGVENGHNLYRFNYKEDPNTTYAGVLAHEVIDIDPDAVDIVNGYYTVNYDKIGVQMRII